MILGNFLVVKRADDPGDALANVWGFPAATLKEGETPNEACQRVGIDKLRVQLEIGQKIAESTHDRSSYTLNLTDFYATIVKGEPKVPQPDSSVSQYQDCKFTNDPTILFEAARKGSQCTQIYLDELGVSWKSEN